MKRLIRLLLPMLLVAAATTFVSSAPASATSVMVKGYNATLRAGCQQYPVDYRISLNDPSHDWSLSWTVNGPKGWAGSGFKYEGYETSGREYMQLCDSFDGPGTYKITYEFTEHDADYNVVGSGTGTSSFVVSRKPTAKLSLAGSTARKAAGNKAVFKVKTKAKVGKAAIKKRKMAVYVARGGSEWVRKGSIRTNSKGVATKKVVWKWGEIKMPKRLMIKVCVTTTSGYNGNCTVKTLKVRR